MVVLIQNQHIKIIVVYEGYPKMLYECIVLIDVLICPQYWYPTVYELPVIFEDAYKVSLRLCTQDAHQPDILADLVQLVKT